MPWQYNGEHSIDFLVDDENHSKVNTWTDWYLVPKTRPVVNPPGLKSNIVDIPGANGSVDLTTALNGYPLYSDRSGQFEFILDNKYMNRYGPLSWGTVYTNIMTYLHGQKVKMWTRQSLGFGIPLISKPESSISSNHKKSMEVSLLRFRQEDPCRFAQLFRFTTLKELA